MCRQTGKDEIRDRERDLLQGIYCNGQRLASCIDLSDEYKKPTVKENTIDTYEIIYKKHIKKLLGSRKIKEVRPEMIQRLYNSMKKHDLSKSTTQTTGTIFARYLLQQAYKNEMIQKNPVSMATIPKMKNKKESRVMTLEEQKLFMEYAKDSEIADICELFLSTGLRSGD